MKYFKWKLIKKISNSIWMNKIRKLLWNETWIFFFFCVVFAFNCGSLVMENDGWTISDTSSPSTPDWYLPIHYYHSTNSLFVSFDPVIFSNFFLAPNLNETKLSSIKIIVNYQSMTLSGYFFFFCALLQLIWINPQKNGFEEIFAGS